MATCYYCSGSARCHVCTGTGVQGDGRVCAVCGGNGRCTHCTGGVMSHRAIALTAQPLAGSRCQSAFRELDNVEILLIASGTAPNVTHAA